MSDNNKPGEESFIDKMKQRASADRAEKIKDAEKNKTAELSKDKKEHDMDEKATQMANDPKDLSKI